MTILKFPTKSEDSPFFEDLAEDGYHIFSLKSAKVSGFYPNEFPEFDGVRLKDLQIGDEITVRVFFRVGSGEDFKVEGGYIDFEIEQIDDKQIIGIIITELPENFTLAKGTSLEIFEEEILYKRDITEH